MTLARTLRSWHKWLALLLGIQLLLWAVSGFYMVAVNIDFIHGDSLVRDPLRALDLREAVLTIPALVERHPELLSARLTSLPGSTRPVYELETPERRLMIDAVSGEALTPLSKQTVAGLAVGYYAGDGRIARAELIDGPVEARGRRAPLWRVDFDDRFDTTLYLDPDTGALITRRHRWWRLYDTFWMLHLMDYGDERDDVNNKLMRFVAAASMLMALSGVGLLFYSFRRKARNGGRPS